MKKSLPVQTLSLALAALVLGLSGCGPSSPRDYKQYRQEINKIQWSSNNQFLVLDYIYGKNINNNIYGDHLLFTYDLVSKNLTRISESQYFCGLFFDSQFVLSTKKKKDFDLFFFLFDIFGEKKQINTPTSSCPLYLNEQLIILFQDVNQQNKLILVNRATQEKIVIEPDESVQKFIQDENIPEYKIEQIFEKNGVLRLILSGSVGYTPENPHPPKTYATALLQDNKMTQIEKLIYLEKPFGIRMVFWGLSPDNKLIFGKETGSPPLEYFEYDYEKRQRNPRPDLDKINSYLTDGRILDPDAFSPDFSQFVTVQGIAEDAERNTIRELALYDVATGKRVTLFNINDTLPKGDYKTVVR